MIISCLSFCIYHNVYPCSRFCLIACLVKYCINFENPYNTVLEGLNHLDGSI
uniref:Uncharacterized protein n=1 Tax=Arundo donax TaxID=35708 RepID=A0A0A9C8F7_ARUDO